MLTDLLVGEIVSVHGVRGGLRVKPLTDDPARFEKLDEVDVKLPSGSGNAGKLSGTYRVSYAAVSGNTVILMLEGIDDRNTAELMRGAMLSVPREKAVKLPEDTYFIGDLIGCLVYEFGDGADEQLYDENAPGVNVLGRLFDVQHTGGNDIYGVRTPDGREMYLPAIGEVIRRVDVREGKIFVKLLPGLREVYLS